MKLSHFPISPSPHKECVLALCWSSSNEAYSCSLDRSLWRWNRVGEPLSKVCAHKASVTDIHWNTLASQGHSKVSGGGTFAVSHTDGTLNILSKGGQEEQHISAHKGRILCLRWNVEGTALATGGEDGLVKVWSRNGILRSNVFEGEHAIRALSWSPESNQLIFSSANNLVIKYVQTPSKHFQWKGHEGLVVKVEWNPKNNLIVSVGEEGCYKVWDCFGRLSYASQPSERIPVSISWCPSGNDFFVAFQNLVILCDSTGRILSKEIFEVGIIQSLAWNIDGTQLAVGCTNGMVVFSHVVGRTAEWFNIIASIEDGHHILIEDILCNKSEKLEFQDIVTQLSLGFGHLIVATMCQCIIYNVHDWKSHTLNMKDIGSILKQCDNCFLIKGFPNELQIISYEGRKISNPCIPGLRVDLLNSQNASLSKDLLAVVDSTNPKCLKFFDTCTGKELHDALHHNARVIEIGLNQQGNMADRMIIFLDSNYELFITSVLKPSITKLACTTTKAVWSDRSHIIIAAVENNLVVWYYPQAVFIDIDLVKDLQIKTGSFRGEYPDVRNFLGRHCMAQQETGAVLVISLSPTACLLLEYISENKWAEAKKLCWQFKQERHLWAVLAAAAMHVKDFDIAEEAYTALEEVKRLIFSSISAQNNRWTISFEILNPVTKVEFIRHLRAQSSELIAEAEYALFKKQTKDAELILLNAGLIYRAIKLNIRLFNWDRALEIAVAHKKHIDTVLWKRREYLLNTNQKETKEAFQSLLSEVNVDVEKIKERISEEKSFEKNTRSHKLSVK